MAKDTNKLELSLTTLCRWKAFIRKYRGYTSTRKDEDIYVSNLHDYQKKWIRDGVGTPLANIAIIDIWEAIETFNISINYLGSFDCEDMKLYYDACYALEYNE